MPKRIQLSRRRGSHKPDGAVTVARPSEWGNPFRVGRDAANRADAVARYRALVLRDDPEWAAFRERVRAELRGKDLCCWCPLDGPCHADTLLEIANG